jgi:hypothetical protein
MPLFAGMVVTAVVTYGILMFESSGFRPVELIIGSLVGIIGLCYLIEMFIASPGDIAARLLDHLMDLDNAPHPGMPQVKDLPLLRPVGVMESCCTMRRARTWD